ncbi:MAG: universal stress protein [Thermodesulfovibrio sp.]|uniref:universal stress protein n=1 Tax=unclassified Thermodesulfovibrio TaxID=2645936 RepID=UPI00083B53A1|nr:MULTISPECIES: universal stress protein [unclassified Thermodesulfovibrio]MDI1472350.1 universal stress protein [Thermodesulfovibrio sp. 1176]MDI6714215.1 universal stress protein [Thermodesulfovibrio sp.]ODA43771.1 Uncharacterized protein THER_1526 [Thermodesulfovibrio sp. N1]
MKKILVPTDGSANAEKAINKAIEMIKKEEAELIILNVAEDFCPVGLDQMDCQTIRELVMKESKNIIASTLEKIKKEGINARGVVEVGAPAETIIDFAEKEKVDEIIIASHGRRGLKKFLMGSVAKKVLEGASCPVTVIKA